MKIFQPLFAAELAKQTGITPIWILRSTIDSVVYDLSDIAYTFPVGSLNGFAGRTLPWVASWGAVRENIAGNIGEILVADIPFTLLVDQDYDNNIRYLALQHEIEKSPCELYLWLDGLDATAVHPELMFRGYIKDLDIPDETQVHVTVEDESTRLRNYIGTKITSEVYPLCDPDVVGQVIPIVFGTVPKLPALCVDAGWVSSIPADMTATDNSITVSEIPAYNLFGKTILIDDEQMLVSGQSTVPGNGTGNLALAATVALTTGSIVGNGTVNGFNPPNVNNGDRLAAGWGGSSTANGGLYAWLGSSAYLATLDIDFGSAKALTEVHIFSIQTNYGIPVDPTSTMTSIHALKTFKVQYWNGSVWVDIQSVVNNTLVWKKIVFASITTSKIRIYITEGGFNGGVPYAAIAEVEVYSTASAGTMAKTLTVVRGFNGTIPVLHTKASVVIEKKATPLVYLCADHALDTIGTILATVRGINVDITSDCTKYLGTSGSQLPAYPGRAAITIPDIARVSQRISLALANSLAVSQGSHTHATSTNTTTIRPNAASVGYPATSNNNWNNTFAQRCWDNDQTTYMDGVQQQDYSATWLPNMSDWGTKVKFNFVGTSANNIANCLRIRVGAILETNADYGGYPPAIFLVIKGVVVLQQNLARINAKQTYYTGWIAFTDMADLYNYATQSGSYACVNLARVTGYKLYEIWFEIETGQGIPASAATGVSLYGSLGLSGNSVADIAIGSAVLVDCNRSSVTLPHDVCNNLLTTWCNDTSLMQVGTLLASYTFNGAIRDYKTALEWLDLLAFQARCWFRKIAGVSKLIVRSAVPVNPTVVSACALTSEGVKDLAYRKAPITDVINVINVLYNRDWSSTQSAALAYQSSQASTDAASIANYGRLEQPSMFMFDFVANQSMAADLAQFYHDFYAVRKWLVTFRTFLDKAHLEFADDLQLGFANDLTGVVIEAGIQPGAENQIDSVQFTIATTHIPVEVPFGMHTLLGDQVHTKDRETVTYE